MNEIEELRKAFERRWRNIEEKGMKFNKGIPDKKELWLKLRAHYENGFQCAYCNRKMLIKDSKYPYGLSFSFDHKRSLWLGGSNSVDNIEIVCTRCNQIKGTMLDITYLKMISAIRAQYGDGLLEEIFEQISAGRRADKIEREVNVRGAKYEK